MGLCPERSSGDGASWPCERKGAVRQRIRAKRLQLGREAPRVRRRALRSGEQSDQRVDVGGREGSICFRQERMPHWLALEADVGGMALQAAEGAGNAFAGFWHGGAFSRLATDLPIAQGRVDGGVIRASRAVRRSLGCRAQGSGRAGPRKESRRNCGAHDRTTRRRAAFQTSVFSAISSASSTSTPR